jgi:hypothetical protein
MLLLTRSLVARSARLDSADVTGPLDEATALAERVGDAGNDHYMSLSPLNTRVWRLSLALEGDEDTDAVTLADEIAPRLPELPPKRQVTGNIGCARAWLTVPGRRPDAAAALARAERVSPESVTRSPLARRVLAGLVTTTRADALGPVITGMVHRAGWQT